MSCDFHSWPPLGYFLFILVISILGSLAMCAIDRKILQQLSESKYFSLKTSTDVSRHTNNSLMCVCDVLYHIKFPKMEPIHSPFIQKFQIIWLYIFLLLFYYLIFLFWETGSPAHQSSLDPHRKAFRNNGFTENAISTALHSVFTHERIRTATPRSRL